MSTEKQTKPDYTQWNIRNVPVDLDKEVKIFLATNNMKLYDFVLTAIKDKLNSGK